MSARPEGHAMPDDQGKLGFCTRYALGKAIANGFMDKDFVQDLELDFDQNAIIAILVDKEKDAERLWPTFFNGVTLRLQENETKEFWTITVKVEIVSDVGGDGTPGTSKKMDEFHLELTSKQDKHEHILVYDYVKDLLKYKTAEEKKDLEKMVNMNGIHAVYVHKYNDKKKVMTCINSHGSSNEDNPYPRVALSEARHLFRVTCSAKKCNDQ